MFIFCLPATVSTSVVVVSGTVVIPVTTYKSSGIILQVCFTYSFIYFMKCTHAIHVSMPAVII